MLVFCMLGFFLNLRYRWFLWNCLIIVNRSYCYAWEVIPSLSYTLIVLVTYLYVGAVDARIADDRSELLPASRTWRPTTQLPVRTQQADIIPAQHGHRSDSDPGYQQSWRQHFVRGNWHGRRWWSGRAGDALGRNKCPCSPCRAFYFPLGFLSLLFSGPRVGPGGGGTPFPPCLFTSPSFALFLLFPSLIGFNYFLLLSIPFLSPRIVSLRFQAGGRRRRPNLGLVCCVYFVCIP